MASFKISKRDVLSVYDGDTFTIRFKCSPSFTTKISVRVLGMDAPELSGSTEHEKRWARDAKHYLKHSLKNSGSIKLSSVKWCKYGGRIVARVIVDGEDIAKTMIKQGLAREYDGGKRGPWPKRRPKVKIEFNWWRLVRYLIAAGIMGLMVVMI